MTTDFWPFAVSFFSLFVDGVQLWTGPPAGQSFWQFGDFDTAAPGIDNPWAAASNLAPFDQEVSEHWAYPSCPMLNQ